ncbi:MAG: HAMP domain-containing histidine kinase [Xanthomonadales bacterium]|nr:HAMP domain-containing histidine kinase [Xanthomonadales bacterium]
MSEPPKAAARTGIRRQLWAAYILQVAAISFATVLGVYGASAVLKDVLIQRALTEEAAHFWHRLAQHPDAELPDTANMRGYLMRTGEVQGRIPDYLKGLDLGYHALPKAVGAPLVLVEDGAGGRLYLEFKQEQVARLAFFFGFVPLAVVLIVIYVVAWVTYRVSRRAVSPLIWLAEAVKRWDPKDPASQKLAADSMPLDLGGEVEIVAHALQELGERLGHFVERERQFTRDASHELRTPLTIMRTACDLMAEDCQLETDACRNLARVRGAVRDMEGLIEAFLIMAREGDRGLPSAPFVVNEIATEQVESLRPLLADKPVTLDVEHRTFIAVDGSPRALAVMLSNLIRNACGYTERGEVMVRVESDRVEVVDTGRGMEADELERAFEPFFRGRAGGDGQGIGLAIVRRLSGKFGWPVSLHSRPGEGTRAIIHFPHTRPVDE